MSQQIENLHDEAKFIKKLKDTLDVRESKRLEDEQELVDEIIKISKGIFYTALNDYFKDYPDNYCLPKEINYDYYILTNFECRLKVSNEVKRLIHIFNKNVNNPKFKLTEDDEPIIDLYDLSYTPGSLVRYKIKFPDINSLKSEDF